MPFSPNLVLRGIAIDSTGKIYFTETGTNNSFTTFDEVVRINDITGAGEVDFGTVGTGINQFETPWGIVVTL